jgi:hypothetical protein
MLSDCTNGSAFGAPASDRRSCDMIYRLLK